MRTKKNHYNPCLWTANWCPSYFEKVMADPRNLPDCRTQQVQVLSVKSGTIFTSAVQGIHFDKHLAWAEITREEADKFCRKYHPDKYREFRRKNKTAHYPVYINFEEVLTYLDASPAYQTLRSVIRRGYTQTPTDKGFMSCFVSLHNMRSHAIMNSMIEIYESSGMPKFEYFLNIKWLMGDTNAMLPLVGPLSFSHWTFYQTEVDTFPLCDSPILIRYPSVMVALSPRLLLEISRDISAPESQYEIRKGIDPSKLEEFRLRTIGNTFREIIFGDKALLERWKDSPEFRERLRLMQNRNQYNSLISDHKNRELWKINAFGNN